MRVLQRDSLVTRQLFASIIVLPLFLGLSAWGLYSAFKASLESAERESLNTRIYLLLGAADISDGGLYMPESLAEPKFEFPQSGLYALVVDESDNIVWQSSSLAQAGIEDYQLPLETIIRDSSSMSSSSFNGSEYYQYFYDTTWEIDGQEKGYRFIVLHDQNEVRNKLRVFRATLMRWLGALAVLLLASQWLIVIWGLTPLKRLAKDLKSFQKGETNRLEGNYPTEITPVTDNLNAVLEAEKNQRSKYKNTLSDLAHSLKTPLAIIRSQLTSPAGEPRKDETLERPHKNSQTIDEQVTRMSDIVNHHLRRATLASTNIQTASVKIQDVVARLGTALNKVYRDKNITFENKVSEGCIFQGDENDLMEFLGNLMENAFKYGTSKVLVSAQTIADEMIISVEDDGPGVDQASRKKILNRGSRVDTSTQGQGIGLAITVDIVSSYGGGLAVEESIFGGAKFKITLPLNTESNS